MERIVWRRGVGVFTVMTMIMKNVFSMYVGGNCRWVPLAFTGFQEENNVSVLQAQRFP